MVVKEGYKKTEVGVIPEDWEVKTLGYIGDVKMCKRIFSYQTKESGIIPFYKIGTFGKEADAYISEELYNTYRNRFSFPKKGDILISASGTLGRTVVYDGKPAYFQDSNIIWIENDQKSISNKFLYHVLQVVQYESEGSTIQRLYNNIVLNTTFVLPPLKEQTAIATVLSDTDNLIQALEKKIAKKELIKKGAMQELLEPKEGWEKVLMPEVCWFQEGPGVRNYQFTNSGVKLLNGTNIEKGKLLLEKTERYISNEEAFGWYSHFLVDEGDILIACSGVSIEKFHEKVTFAESKHLPLCMNTSTMRFKIKSSEITKDFLFHFLKSNSFKEQIGGKATGSAQLNFGPSHVSKVYISMPSRKEQFTIAQILSDMDTEIESLQEKLSKYKQLKQGLMQELLTGRIRLV